MYQKLKELCKKKGTNVTQLCIEVTGNSGNLATWKKGYMRSDYLAKSAEILGVSTDYLLGRDSYCENSISTGNISSGDNSNNNTGVHIVSTSNTTDSTENQFFMLFNKLGIENKVKVMNLTLELSKAEEKN